MKWFDIAVKDAADFRNKFNTAPRTNTSYRFANGAYANVTVDFSNKPEGYLFEISLCRPGEFVRTNCKRDGKGGRERAIKKITEFLSLT